MDEEKLEKILSYASLTHDFIHSDNPYICWNREEPDTIELDGVFNAEELEAIAWRMKN